MRLIDADELIGKIQKISFHTTVGEAVAKLEEMRGNQS